jgi:AMMECR1 domain-containing protein
MVESDTTGVMKDKIARYCFANLVYYLREKSILKPPEEFDAHKYALFVTWLKDGDLAGCIGTFA